ncbi:hypothetical protein F4604DRAFT_1934595 [Suillus subluteus]|nr:hypothetical protein F4604DRAFT_1934595 [Suillus subluteus]
MSFAPDQNHLLHFSAHRKEILVGNQENSEDSHLITHNQLKLFVAYSHTLRNKTLDACPPSPLGYEFFAHAFNSEGLPSTASYVDEHGVAISTGAGLELTNILEEEADTAMMVSSARFAEVEQMVWHTALSMNHQCQRMEARRTEQKKEKNYVRKQEQKIFKKGFGKVRKMADQRPAIASAGPSMEVAPVKETMAAMD